jgi:histidinol-phosphate aminotransferase
MTKTAPDYILSIQPYRPGKPIEELEREYGLSYSIKLASNENPLGPSPRALQAIESHLKKLNRYPDGAGFDLIGAISEKMSIATENIVLGNGSDEIIGLLARALLMSGDEVILPHPSFLMYDIMVRSVGAVPVTIPLDGLSIDLKAIQAASGVNTKMIFLCNPNNPTGTIFSKDAMYQFLDRIPTEVIVVVDEAYIEFVRDSRCARGLDFVAANGNVVTLRTFSKAYGLAGLRVGYGIMRSELAEVLNRIRPPFNTSVLAQVGAAAALSDEAFLAKTLRVVHDGIDFLQKELDKMGITYYPTQANFFLIDVNRNADTVFEEMLKKGVIVRSMTSYGYPQYIRINSGRHEENVRFIEALKDVL